MAVFPSMILWLSPSSTRFALDDFSLEFQTGEAAMSALVLDPYGKEVALDFATTRSLTPGPVFSQQTLLLALSWCQS